MKNIVLNLHLPTKGVVEEYKNACLEVALAVNSVLVSNRKFVLCDGDFNVHVQHACFPYFGPLIVDNVNVSALEYQKAVELINLCITLNISISNSFCD